MDPLVPVLTLVALALAAILYAATIRRRGFFRRRARADEWDRATSQARAVQRLERLQESDGVTRRKSLTERS